MKRFLLFFLVIVAISFLNGCYSSLPQRITRLADKVESKGSNFSQEDWDKTTEKFKSLISEFADNYDKFSPSEKKEVYKAVAKYSSAAIKCGAQNAVSGLEEILHGVESATNSFIDSAKDFLDSLNL